VPFTDQLRLAVAAYLARFKGSSRDHTQSDLRCFLLWCADLGSPTLGFTHLQFGALLTAARQSAHPCDFALVAMLGLLGLRIFEVTGANIADLGEEHGHRVLRVCGRFRILAGPLSGHDRTVWFAVLGSSGRRYRCYRCLTYQRSMVSVCPFHDRVNCQQPGAGTSISEG